MSVDMPLTSTDVVDAVQRHPSTRGLALGETDIIVLQQLALFGKHDIPRRYRRVRGPNRVHLMLLRS